MTNLIRFSIDTAEDLLNVLILLKKGQELDTIYLHVNRSDRISGVRVEEKTLSDGSPVSDIHFLIAEDGQ
jgi:hypothetical protein